MTTCGAQLLGSELGEEKWRLGVGGCDLGLEIILTARTVHLHTQVGTYTHTQREINA